MYVTLDIVVKHLTLQYNIKKKLKCYMANTSNVSFHMLTLHWQSNEIKHSSTVTDSEPLLPQSAGLINQITNLRICSPSCLIGPCKPPRKHNFPIETDVSDKS